MKSIAIIFLLVTCAVFSVAQNHSEPDFTWNNGSYYNIDIGESIVFNDVKIKLLSIEKNYNSIQINNDTLWLKVSRRTLSQISNGIRIFVADNVEIKKLTDNNELHGLLQKDALLCLSDLNEGYIDLNKYIFPVSFNDGFIWNVGEDGHMFSYMAPEEKGNDLAYSHPGIDINLHDARGKEKHMLVALENSRVVWIIDKKIDEENNEACILLESESQPGIYYLYEHLYNRNIYVRKGQKLLRGEPIGSIWGDDIWGYLQLTVLKSDSIPAYENRYVNVINFFPQLYELYFNRSYSLSRNFSKGRILFGMRRDKNGNHKNIEGLEPYYGKGWIFDKWNATDKTEWITNGSVGNARIRKTMFSGQKAQTRNPKNYFDYEINVTNGVYRIRAKVGDLKLESQQKVEFEGVVAFHNKLGPGIYKWTNERIVKVNDGKLTIRIFVDETNETVAGLSEIVFQQAY